MPTGGFRSGRSRSGGPARPAAPGGYALLGAIAFGAVTVLACSWSGPSPAAPSGATAGPAASGASPQPSVTEGERLRYVALGDSYTIGTSVAERERWPNQLVGEVPELELVANLAVNGFTSRDVIEVELPRLVDLRPDFVTLLIGVNDVVQGVPAETYRENLRRILDEAVDLVGPGRVVMVTTPDYTVTPAGGDYGDPATQSAGIRASNAIASEIALVYGVRVVDVYGISLEAGSNRALVAGDGLHPSGAQYARWVEVIAPAVIELLADEAH